MRMLDPCGCFPTGRHYPGIAHLIVVRAVGLAEEIEPDEPWQDLRIAFIDVETTGTDPRQDRVIEIGVVIGVGGEVRERLGWLVNPGVPIAAESTEIHGIKDEDVADAPPFSAVAGAVLSCLAGAVPAAYNAEFDRGFVHAELDRLGLMSEPSLPPTARLGVQWLDPLVFARELYKGKGESRALGAVAERLGIALDRAHRATDDAEAALRVLYAMAADPRVPRTYGALLQEQQRLGRQQDEATRFWRR